MSIGIKPNAELSVSNKLIQNYNKSYRMLRVICLLKVAYNLNLYNSSVNLYYIAVIQYEIHSHFFGAEG